MSTAKELIDKGKTQEQLEEELGAGVEKDPILPLEPKLEKVNLDLSGATDVSKIITEIAKLPDPNKAKESTDKYDKYEETAKKIWVVKMAARDSFTIKLNKIKEKQEIEIGGQKFVKHIWERDDKGKIVSEDKVFYFNGLTIQEKDLSFRFLSERESLDYEMQRVREKLIRISKKEEKDLTDEEREYIDSKPWVEAAHKYNLANEQFYINRFKSYYGATDEEIDRIVFGDIVNYGEIAVYKEGVKSPLYVEP